MYIATFFTVTHATGTRMMCKTRKSAEVRWQFKTLCEEPWLDSTTVSLGIAPAILRHPARNTRYCMFIVFHI